VESKKEETKGLFDNKQ